MSGPATTGLTLDTGALLALDHPAKALIMQARLDEARRRGGVICIPADVVAQAWRGSRQARLARLLKSRDLDIAVMTLSVARSIGLMCAASGHSDVIDVHVVLCARQRRHAIVTSDPQDISRIDPAVPRVVV
ncbi:MAG: type II toxin-antitoxin system VapC family toxin [Actinobacteria bacterium]|nr:type II toxin-antitoxin system VapC family toxin [Actinomycetota bacterium]